LDYIPCKVEFNRADLVLIRVDEASDPEHAADGQADEAGEVLIGYE
jgi:hypothetical protein